MRFLPYIIPVLMAALPAQSKSGLYDVDNLRSFHLTFASTNWYSSLQTARSSGSNVKADMVVDGKTYKDVGVRFRGNSSYSTGSSKKKSFNITMDAFKAGQQLMGFDSLNLSNGYYDPTFCREVVSYEILRRYMPAPNANYVKLYVNKVYWGLYMNVQQPDGKMIKEWYGEKTGNRYRCDAPTSSGSGNSALQWLGTNLQNYKNAYELKTDLAAATKPWEDVRNLCNVLNNSNNLKTDLPKALDVDQTLWYLALNIVLVNLDSYVNRGNDYYLYHDTQSDTISLLPWDMNESFGGYTAGLSVNSRIKLSPFYNATRSSRPLLGKLFGDPEWSARYIHHVKTIIDESFNWKYIGPLVTKYQKLIDAAVKADTQKLYSYAAFSSNVTSSYRVSSRTTLPGLKQLADGRQTYITSRTDYKAVRATLSKLGASPTTVYPGTAVNVTVKIQSTVGLASTTLYYRRSGPWLATALLDDGKHADGKANDGVFGATIPGSLSLAGHRVEYYVEARSATTSGGASTYLPKGAAFAPPAYVVRYKLGLSPVRINEVMAKNASGLKDEKGEREDWIELYNSSANPVKIAGMYLTDDPKNPTQWKIPSGQTIAGKSTLLIWCDGDAGDGPLHASFKLSGSGETLLLVDTDGVTALDSLRFGPQADDVSNGLLLDGDRGQLVAYKAATPAMPNSMPCGSRAYWPVAYAAHAVDLTWTGTPALLSACKLGGSGYAKSSSALLYVSLAPNVIAIGGGMHLMLAPTSMAGPSLVPTNAAGDISAPLTIPNDKTIKGVGFYMQAALMVGTSFVVSNGLEIRICQ